MIHRFHPWAKIAFCCVLLALTTGCVTHDKGFWKKRMADSGTLTMSGEYQKEGLKPPLVLNEKQITNSVVGTETNGSVRVSYVEDLQPQASLVASAVERSLVQTEQALVFPLQHRLHIYLLRLTNEQRVIQFNLTAPVTPRTLPWLMLLTNCPAGKGLSALSANDQLWCDLSDLPGHVFTIAHEACETRLIDPRELLAMGDVDFRWGFLHVNLKYHTRWFREGLAHYTGCQASQSLRRFSAEIGVKPGCLRFVEDRMQPFSELARVRARLFDWNQSSIEDFYPAALALFLLIEQKFGAEAVREIIRELPNLKFPDGKTLRKLVERKTGTDPLQLARSFKFPDLGLATRVDAQGQCEIEEVAADKWAARAKLQKGDVILEANARPITGLLGLDQEVLNALDRGGALSVTVLRNGERHVTQATPLFPPERGRTRSTPSQAELTRSEADCNLNPAKSKYEP